MLDVDAFNAHMIQGGLRQVTAVVLLLSQLLLVVLGGPLLVQCQRANDHTAIELAHANLCDDSATAWTPSETIFALPGQFIVGPCVDTPLVQPTVLSHVNRSSLLFAKPALLVDQITELPGLRFSFPEVPLHVFSPDSAESLARTVILLI